MKQPEVTEKLTEPVKWQKQPEPQLKRHSKGPGRKYRLKRDQQQHQRLQPEPQDGFADGGSGRVVLVS